MIARLSIHKSVAEFEDLESNIIVLKQTLIGMARQGALNAAHIAF